MRDRSDKIAADAVGLFEAGHQALLALVELRPIVLDPAAGLLAEVPEDHLGARQRTDERGTDRGEGPWGACVAVGDDLVANGAVGEEDERDCQQVDRPILIEGYQRHDHEEVEVQFGLSPQDVDQHHGAAQQAEAGSERAQAAHTRQDGRAEQQRRRAGRQQPLPDAELPVRGAADDDRQMDSEDPDQQPVAGNPVLGGQAAPMRHPAPGPPAELLGGKDEVSDGSMAG